MNTGQIQLQARALIAQMRGRWERAWAHFQTLSLLQRRLAAAAGLLVFLVVMEQGILKPLNGTIRSLDTKIAAAELKSLQTRKSVLQKPGIEQAYAQLVQSVDFSTTTDEQVRAAMLRDIESLAREMQMNLSDVRPQISVDRSQYKEISVRLQVDGTLSQLARFFAGRLVRTRRLYSIDSFRITPHPEDIHKIRANITIARAFFSTK
jgi:Tfp pilus assembly protein PilO